MTLRLASSVPLIRTALPTSISLSAPQQKTAPVAAPSVVEAALPSVPIPEQAPMVSTMSAMPITSDAVATLTAPSPAAPVSVPTVPQTVEVPQITVRPPAMPAESTPGGDAMQVDPTTYMGIPSVSTKIPVVQKLPITKVDDRHGCAWNTTPVWDPEYNIWQCKEMLEDDRHGCAWNTTPVWDPEYNIWQCKEMLDTPTGPKTHPTVSTSMPNISVAAPVIPSMTNIRTLGPVSVTPSSDKVTVIGVPQFKPSGSTVTASKPRQTMSRINLPSIAMPGTTGAATTTASKTASAEAVTEVRAGESVDEVLSQEPQSNPAYLDCPAGFVNVDNVCQKIQPTLACPEGFVNVDNVCHKKEAVAASSDKTNTYLMYGAGALAVLGIAYLVMRKGK